MGKSRLRYTDMNRARLLFGKAHKHSPCARIRRLRAHLGIDVGQITPPRELRMISWRRF